MKEWNTITSLQIQEIVYHSIEWAWELIKEDYDNSMLCHEGSLEGAMYFHLRNLLFSLIKNNNIRIWNQFSISRKKVDIAIVEFDRNLFFEKKIHLKKSYSKIIAFIELKYVLWTTSKWIQWDTEKIKELIKKHGWKWYVYSIQEWKKKIFDSILIDS